MIRFSLNGTEVEEAQASPNTTLLQYVRTRLGLTGTKEGCAEGDCGACTVAILDHDAPGGPAWRAVNACLVLLPMVHGKQVVTVEGLSAEGAPHPVQESLVRELGSQCGYCTPGVVMSMFEACYRDDIRGADADWKVDDQMCGNLCRCTGYRPIRDATQQIAGARPNDPFVEQLSAPRPAVDTLDYASNTRHGAETFSMPRTLPELWDALDRDPAPLIVAGGTDLSLRVTKGFERLPQLLSLEGLDALRGIRTESDGSTWVGATTPLSDVESALKSSHPPIERMLRFFGSRQIKNRGTLGGNLCNASPIGDLPPVLISLGADAVLRSRDGERSVPLDTFFVDYRKTQLADREVLAGVRIPALDTSGRVLSSAYKVSKRQELDISCVAAGFFVELDDTNQVVRARLAYGGMAATPKRAANAEAALVGRTWNETTVDDALAELERDFAPIDDHRGSAWYRMRVAKNLLRGFYLETRQSPSPQHGYRPTGTLNPEATS